MTEWGIDTLFNPSKRHMDEEKRRLQSTREEVGDSSGGQRIDLDSGKLVIKRRPKPADSAVGAEPAEADESAIAEPVSAAEPVDPEPADETDSAK